MTSSCVTSLRRRGAWIGSGAFRLERDRLPLLPARSSRGGSPRRFVSRPCRACAPARSDRAIELLAQDVGVPGVPVRLVEDVNHDVEELHVRAWPPRHMTGHVDVERGDGRVRCSHMRR